MISPKIVLLSASLALAFLLVLVGLSGAHDAPMGWSYDAACRSGEDCKPLPEGSVTPVSGGYLLRETGEVVPSEKARQGKDENYHLYRSNYSGMIFCIYLPMQGS